MSTNHKAGEIRPPLVTVADFTQEWIDVRAEIAHRDGHALRKGAHANTIEVQSINTGEWGPLTLPQNTTLFAKTVERDAILELLVQTVATFGKK